jgi:hypothetical protein
MFWPVVVSLSTAFTPGLRVPEMVPPPVTDQVSAKAGDATAKEQTVAAATTKTDAEYFRMGSVPFQGWERIQSCGASPNRWTAVRLMPRAVVTFLYDYPPFPPL